MRGDGPGRNWKAKMSGPLSSSEIEDVVSSVRRLVSTETRPRPVSRDLGQDRLLLTPALQVVTDQPTPAAEPLILTQPAPPEAEPLVEALSEPVWEDQIWPQADAPLAELALGAEEAVLVVHDPLVEPEVEALAWTGPGPAANEPTPPDSDLDVTEMLTAAVVEDEGFRHLTEDELQDLVRMMVRQELQGSLGERITRNVRKLVRAEINRALAAQALD